jgi:hypothetical protein
VQDGEVRVTDKSESRIEKQGRKLKKKGKVPEKLKQRSKDHIHAASTYLMPSARDLIFSQRIKQILCSANEKTCDPCPGKEGEQRKVSLERKSGRRAAAGHSWRGVTSTHSLHGRTPHLFHVQGPCDLGWHLP